MKLNRLSWDKIDWNQLNQLPDRTIFQTQAWLQFVQETQNAEPLVANIMDNGKTVGYFTGWIFRKFGIRMLGSPLPGTTTNYTGFNMLNQAARGEALAALINFAFRDLKCLHVELMDRRLTIQEGTSIGFDYNFLSTYEIDLTKSEDQILLGMEKDTRRCIRNAEKNGLKVEEVYDLSFADDYYAQLEDVFAKQKLVPTYSKQRVKSLIHHMIPTGQLLFLRVLDPEKKCLATGIFPAFNDTMFFWGGASWRWGQKLHPNELIQWYAIRYWKSRGISRYDMGGGGSYKAKYGGSLISVPWFRKSRYKFLAQQRDNMKQLVRIVQRISGRIQQRH